MKSYFFRTGSDHRASFGSTRCCASCISLLAIAQPVAGQTPGTLDTSFTPVLGSSDAVTALAIQPNGHLIAGGLITSVNGQPAVNLMRLQPNGIPETTSTFNPGAGPDSVSRAFAIQPDGKILIAGEFTVLPGLAWD